MDKIEMELKLKEVEALEKIAFILESIERKMRG